MNNDRRKALQKIISSIEEQLALVSEVAGKLEDLNSELEELQGEEEEYRDNMPENLQGSEKYERADAAASAIGDAVEALSALIDTFQGADEEVVGKINEAIEA